MLEADLTSSAMGAQGLRWGMRSLKATSSSFVWTSRTSLLNAGIDRRSAESALHSIPRPLTKYAKATELSYRTSLVLIINL